MDQVLLCHAQQPLGVGGIVPTLRQLCDMGSAGSDEHRPSPSSQSSSSGSAVPARWGADVPGRTGASRARHRALADRCRSQRGYPCPGMARTWTLPAITRLFEAIGRNTSSCRWIGCQFGLSLRNLRIALSPRRRSASGSVPLAASPGTCPTRLPPMGGRSGCYFAVAQAASIRRRGRAG